MSPRAYYLYREESDHSDLFNITDNGQHINFDTNLRTFSYAQLYRDTRFSGKDRLDSANQLTLGFRSEWLSQKNGAHLFDLSLGQIFHFEDTNLGLNGISGEQEDTSELAGELGVSLGPLARAHASAIYNSESGQLSRSALGFSYHSADYRSLFNLSHIYIRGFQQRGLFSQNTTTRDIDQIDASFILPAGSQWSMMGRYNYDFELKQELETFFGLEYNNCCYRIRLLAGRWLDSNIANLVNVDELEHDTGFVFQLHLKGLGGLGKGVDSILNQSIQGYREREKFIH